MERHKDYSNGIPIIELILEPISRVFSFSGKPWYLQDTLKLRRNSHVVFLCEVAMENHDNCWKMDKHKYN
jgi:hypothetical protein